MINSTLLSNLKKSFKEEALSEKEILFKNYVSFDNTSLKNEKRKEFGKVIQIEKKIKSNVVKSLKSFISFEVTSQNLSIDDLEIERILNKKRECEV